MSAFRATLLRGLTRWSIALDARQLPDIERKQFAGLLPVPFPKRSLKVRAWPFEMIEAGGLEEWPTSIRKDLIEKTYRPAPVRRVMIPKPGGNGERPLGIPTIRDRTVQAAAKLVLEPIFDAGHEIVPVLNKIHLPAAEPERVRQQIEDVIGLDASDAVEISAKTGLNIEGVLEALVTRLPPPKGDPDAALKALLVDSWYDQYLGVVILVRVKAHAATLATTNGRISLLSARSCAAARSPADCHP